MNSKLLQKVLATLFLVLQGLLFLANLTSSIVLCNAYKQTCSLGLITQENQIS